MWARPRLSSLFGLTCGLLWLYPVANISCPTYQKALSQVMSTPETDWLQSFMKQQGLKESNLTESCKMTEYVPTVETLQNLSQAAFLQNVSQSLHFVEQQLKDFKDSDIRRMVLSIQGLDNNICCLLQNLPTGPAACPPSGSAGTLPSQADLTFPQKLHGCKTIQWYQSFRKVMKKVLETWDAAPGQRNRKSRSLLRVLLHHRREIRAD
ncbi:uncharacterized protein LOC105749464 [Sarcophilus harrisii]|uniref:uncharacterized protein LOC105749464 n=1 Tax=Sarcophilus harrisii TaxID=9305 RepID=UPI00062B83AE|nr:uncharacterized protein LOC105749464 [Sarcophilus harrisii]